MDYECHSKWVKTLIKVCVIFLGGDRVSVIDSNLLLQGSWPLPSSIRLFLMCLVQDRWSVVGSASWCWRSPPAEWVLPPTRILPGTLEEPSKETEHKQLLNTAFLMSCYVTVFCKFNRMQGAKEEVKSHKDEIRKTPLFDFHFLATVRVNTQ